MFSPWQKIQEENQWGNITYYLNGKKVEKKIKTVDIRWKDGTIEEGKKIIYGSYTTDISEQGCHPYSVTSTMLFVEGNANGHKFKVPLTEVTLDVKSIKWEKEKK